MRNFHDIAGADIGEHGEGWNGPVTSDAVQALTVPWAARYLNCEPETRDMCKGHEYESGCWIEREDVTPPTKQDEHPGGRASWHPGNRIHKIRGRRIALFVLRGLYYALEKWEELTVEGGHPLADEHWHVAEYYKSIREKAPDVPFCYGPTGFKIGQKRHRERTRRMLRSNDEERELEGDDYWPSRLCDIPLQGRSLWGPRANFMETSLLSIMRPNPHGDVDPNPNNKYMWEPIYLPPDLPSPWETPPEDDVDVLRVAGARRLDAAAGHRNGRELRRRSLDPASVWSEFKSGRDEFLDQISGDKYRNATDMRRLASDKDAIVPGYGVWVDWGKDGYCDGTNHNWCAKSKESSCLMGGTHDNRGSVCFDGLSGWVVFDVKNVKHGFIGARMEPWRGKGIVETTNGWTDVNNGGKGNYDKSEDQRSRTLRREREMQAMRADTERMETEIEEAIVDEDPAGRKLGGGQSCGVVDDYTFEWSINGKVTSWNKAQFCDRFTRLAYNIDVMVFLDDASQSGDFELGMRMTNVGREGTMCLTHLYWA